MPYITRQDDISALPLSVRSHNCLRRAEIHTIGAMLDYPTEELINLRNMGVKSVEEIKGFVQAITEGTGDYTLVDNIESIPAEEEAPEPHVTTVFLDATGAVVPDIEIMDLPLSVRPKNSLTHSGYTHASQLVGITFDALRQLLNMGKKSAEEVLACLEAICVQYDTDAAPDTDDAGNALVGEMQAAYGKSESLWWKELQAVRAEYPDAMGETLIYRLYENPVIRGVAKAAVLRLLEENNGELSQSALAEKLPQHLQNTTVTEELLLEMEAASSIAIGEVMIYRQYPSVVEFAASLQDPRKREVIEGRIAGKTLLEIGEQYGVTRERVRQMMQQALKEKPYLREDQYIYLYDHYEFSLEDFTLAFDESAAAYYYLDMISSATHADKKPLEDILTDTAISPALRKKAERAIYRHTVLADGVRIKKTRGHMVRHYVKTYCKPLTRYEDFLAQYNRWVESLGEGCEDCMIVELRTYENRLNQSNYVLWNLHKHFRYYNIPEHDFGELLSTLNLEQFENTELSTLKLFRDYPNLMAQYDIRDEYELHNLLKKIWVTENSSVCFKKMPTIEVGKADTVDQVLSLMIQYAPISADDLAARYEEEYGVKAATVRGAYLRELDPYFYKGIYSIDYDTLPPEQFSRMQEVLTQEFYTIQEAKRLYRREFPQASESLLNPYTLKTLGYHVYPGYSGYIVKNTFGGATDYFHAILTRDDLVDMRRYPAAIRNIATYDAEHRRLRLNYDIIEFAPLQYINFRRLSDAGITRDDLRNYCHAVAAQYEKGEYFTTTSLRSRGFVHPLDDLGFEEWFYASLLFEDRESFSGQRIGGTRIFLRGKPDCTFSNMLVWLLEKHQKLEFYDLQDLLENAYGIFLPREKLLEFIHGTELYYDTIMDTVYIDYDTYFEEI